MITANPPHGGCWRRAACRRYRFVMRMADTPSPDLVLGGVATAGAPREVDPPAPTRPGQLCIDAPIGRVVIPPRTPACFLAVYLSVDVEISWRDTKAHTAVNVASQRYRFAGPMLVVAVQLRVRPLRRRAVPYFVDGLGSLGDPAGPWPLGRLQLKAGVNLADVLRLGELSRLYNRNMHSQVDASTTALLVPRADERELWEIAGRLRKPRK